MSFKKKFIILLLIVSFSFLAIPRAFALDTVTFNEWQFVYRDGTVGQIWDNSFIYRLGEQKSLQAINIYWPSFQGYYNGTVTIQADPAQFPNNSLQLTNQYFKLFVYQNGSYSQQYYVGTCDGNLTCTFNFQGTAEQSSSSRFSIQLLMSNDAFSSAYIFYPAFRVSASVYVSNEANNSNQDIINNQNNNTQNIINNQNENTDKEIESQQVCSFIDKNSIVIDNKYLYNGNLNSNNSFGITDYFKITGSKIKVLSVRSGSAETCFYNINKTIISCISSGNMSVDEYLTIPNNSSYVRFSINKDENKPTFEICKNGNQAIVDSNKQINDLITDESTPDVNGFWSGLVNSFPISTPISDLITMPITLLNFYIDSFNVSCTPVNLGNLYGTDLIMPCMEISRILQPELWSTIDAFFSLFMIYNIAMLCISIYESLTGLKDATTWIFAPEGDGTNWESDD